MRKLRHARDVSGIPDEDRTCFVAFRGAEGLRQLGGSKPGYGSGAL